MKNKITIQEFVGLGVALACIFLARVFPAEKLLQDTLVVMAFFLVIPLLYSKIITKKTLGELGLRLGNWKMGLMLAGAGLLLSASVSYLLVAYSDFSSRYYLAQWVKGGFWSFVLYEVLIVSYFILLYEFFFRGFIMLGILKKMGAGAVILQVAFFGLFLALANSLDWGVSPYIIAALVGGTIAYKTKSIAYSAAYAWLFIVITDALVIGSL